MVAKRSQSPASQAAAQQPRPAQPSAEAPTAATTTSVNGEDLFILNDAGIVVLKAQPYLYLEGRGPFKQVAGELWEKLFTLPNFAPTPQGAWAMWGCGYIDSTKEESDSQRFVYRAGVVRVDGATVDAVEGLSLGTLPGDDCGACRYCKFDMPGPYDALAAAYVDAIKRLPAKGFKQRDCWCFEEYINTPQNTPDPKDLRTAIYIPVDERSDLYTIQGPEVVTLLREPFVHLEGVGEFFETAPKLWGEFHGSHTAVLPMDHMTGMWAGNLVKANGLSLYRPGATFSCSKAEVEKATLLPGAQIGAVGDGKSYARFEITGPFSALGDAFGDCLDRVKAAGLKRREDAFNWETYLSDPAVTAPSENRIDIYVAVE